MNHHQDHPIIPIVNTPGNNKQRPQTCLSIQLMQRCTNNNPNNNKATKTRKPGIYATASLETVDLDQNKVDEFTITLDTDIFGRVDTVFDSGASICCIDQTVAFKYYRRYIRKERSSFDVRTANGDIQLRYYIMAAIRHI